MPFELPPCDVCGRPADFTWGDDSGASGSGCWEHSPLWVTDAAVGEPEDVEVAPVVPMRSGGRD